MMKPEKNGNYVLMHRKRTGLSQIELCQLIGYGGRESVSRHETSANLPPLPTALCYEVIFGVPIGDLFPGLRETVENAVAHRISLLERELQEKSNRSPREARRHAQKLAWIDERRALHES
jgi:transcriptional regulator with XRE-family HTH domain